MEKVLPVTGITIKNGRVSTKKSAGPLYRLLEETEKIAAQAAQFNYSGKIISTSLPVTSGLLLPGKVTNCIRQVSSASKCRKFKNAVPIEIFN